MDHRKRQDERRFKDGGDVFAHARLINHQLKSGAIKQRHVALGAFLGHKACKLVYCDNVVPNGIIWRSRIIPNIEINEWINGLNTWGFLIVYRAAIGLIRLVLKEGIKSKNVRVCLEKGIKILGDFVNDPTSKQIFNVKRFYIETTYLNIDWSYGEKTREYNIGRAVSFIARAMSKAQGCTQYLIQIAIQYDDNKIKQAIRAELYPFLFGEYA